MNIDRRFHSDTTILLLDMKDVLAQGKKQAQSVGFFYFSFFSFCIAKLTGKIRWWWNLLVPPSEVFA